MQIPLQLKYKKKSPVTGLKKRKATAAFAMRSKLTLFCTGKLLALP